MTKLQTRPNKENKPDKTKIQGQLFNLKPSDIKVPTRRARSSMSEEGLNGLTDSIKKQGIIEPIVVNIIDGDYTLIAGERRLQAAKKANFQTVPCIVRPYTAQQGLYAELTENVQREDADPIAEAIVMKALEEEFSQPHNNIANHLGKHRTWVTNRIRLLELPKETQGYIMRGELNPSSALELLSIEDNASQDKLAKEFSEHDYKRNEIRGVVRTLLSFSEKEQIPIRQAVASYFAEKKEAEQQHETTQPTTLETSQTTESEQPKPPRKEVCNGCGQTVLSTRIGYVDSCCDECRSVVSNVLSGRRKKLEEIEANRNN